MYILYAYEKDVRMRWNQKSFKFIYDSNCSTHCGWRDRKTPQIFAVFVFAPLHTFELRLPGAMEHQRRLRPYFYEYIRIWTESTGKRMHAFVWLAMLQASNSIDLIARKENLQNVFRIYRISPVVQFFSSKYGARNDVRMFVATIWHMQCRFGIHNFHFDQVITKQHMNILTSMIASSPDAQRGCLWV